MHIEPLTNKTIKEAIGLIEHTFPFLSRCQQSRLTLHWSLNPDKFFYRFFFVLFSLIEVKYWVAIENQKVIGITGLESYKKDCHEAFWLSWFCIEPAFRGQNFGSQLLDFSIKKAREADKKYLKLSTSTHSSNALANLLYNKRGFGNIKQIKVLGSNFKIIYRKVNLERN